MSSDPFSTPVMPPTDPPGLATEYPPQTPAPAQTGCLTVGMRVLAGICVGAFVLFTPVVLFMFTMERIALNPEIYKQALVHIDFYHQLPSMVAQALRDSVARNPSGNEALANLSSDDMQTIAGTLVTQQWAQQQTESAIDQIFDWLNSDRPTLSVKISMDGIKKQLSGPAGQQAALTVVKSWPPCTQTQLAAAAASVASGQTTGLPVCRPPDDLMPSVMPYFGDLVAQGAQSVPATIDLAAPNGVATPIEPANDPRPTLRLLRTLAVVSLVLPVLLLLLIGALAVRSLRGAAYWWGIPMAVTGILGVLVAALMLPLRDTVTQAMLGQSPAVPGTFEEAIPRVFGYVFQTAGWWIGGAAVAIGALGLFVFLAGFFLGRTQPAAPPTDYSSGSYSSDYPTR